MRELKPVIIFVFLSFSFATTIYAEVIPEKDTYYDDERGERVVDGLHLKIAEDRKVEKSGKYIEAEGLDKYFKRKFDKIFTTLDEITGRLAGMDTRLSALESEMQELSGQVSDIKNKIREKEETQDKPEKAKKEVKTE